MKLVTQLVTPRRFFAALVVVMIALAICSYAANPKLAADGAMVQTSQCKVTLVVDSSTFYMEDVDRLYGIRVVKAGHGKSVGDELTAYGQIHTNAVGERYLEATTLSSQTATHTIIPLRVTSQSIGGEDFAYDATTGAGQAGTGSRTGLNNVGMLVAFYGSHDSEHPYTNSWLYLTDGNDAGWYVSIHLENGFPVWLENVTLRRVNAIGVVSMRDNGGTVEPFIECRDFNDIEYGYETMLTSPSSTFRAGDNLFSLPAPAADPTPSTVLPVPLDQVLMGWDAVAQGVTSYDEWLPWTALYPDTGYWLALETDASISYSGWVNPVTPCDTWLSLPRMGWTIIGCPYTSQVDWNSVLVTDGTVTYTLAQARDLDWLESVLMGWDSETQGLFYAGLDDDFEPVTCLDPWHGYWMQTYTDNLALTITAP